mgnify:CR=1 FL=1
MNLLKGPFSFILHFALTFVFLIYIPKQGQVLGASSIYEISDSIPSKLFFKTKTAFLEKEETELESIPFSTKFIDDPETEYGIENVIEEGVEGTIELTYKITFWEDEIIDKQLISTKITEPKEEIISKGSKIVWRLYSTPDVGRIKYWYKLRVWATKYDANCEGCTGRTFSGTEVKKGVCATDPKVIPLGTNFYVEGYGLCRAEDIGGSIKGNKIDLGYEDVTKGEWRTGYTDIYLLTR